jgi:hypothetical protein
MVSPLMLTYVPYISDCVADVYHFLFLTTAASSTAMMLALQYGLHTTSHSRFVVAETFAARAGLAYETFVVVNTSV